jgi:hypothetical protein
MAISALHQAFRDTVMRGESELAFYGFVAGVAEVRLGLPEQAGLQPTSLFSRPHQGKHLGLRSHARIPLLGINSGQMWRMTGLAIHPAQFVFRPIEGRLIMTCVMTSETSFGILGSRFAETED